MENSNVYLWVGFGAVITVLLILDLGVFHRKSHAVSTKEAAIWTAVWIAVALLFNLAIFYWKGSEAALQYLTGYLIEKSLSVDNLFVFVMIFGAFCVAPAHQHRVLFWGIIGALFMRGLLIAGGAILLEHFFWITYIFGAFLVFTGIKLFVKKETQVHPEKNPLVRLACRFLPMAPDADNGSFTIKQAGKTLLTPLFLVLLTVETTDLVFALDSIPAIFAITTDPLIIFTSNIFAILGLRSLYFLLAGAVSKFYYLQTSLAIILTFVGIKMLIGHYVEIPNALSLAVVILVLTAGIVASIIRARKLKNISIPM
jgi:tellurite resistance protein TerC